ncbi:XRE family transcriptional regulator [Filobacillus milosensis]|uniref:XRE family transcriptional regulator n=2 Tax=Filobacillus milosensis TaxID=94137 RepID=A0A4Y8IML7_9BACI|nr:XRE family transcriptional regulator [Filobacillus milosensis]
MIGKRLKHLLKENGFDYERDKLVDELGLNRSTLQKYINDVRRPTLESIRDIAKHFNTSVDYLVGHSEYVLDTWDHKFLEEFFQYSSDKIKNHFEKRYTIDISDETIPSKLLFGILEAIFQDEFDKSLEDLSIKEREDRKKIYEVIITIFHRVVTLAKSEEKKDELEALLKRLTESTNGEYSFRNTITLEEIEGKTHKTRKEKIKLLKSYIGINVANGQKALRMLEELSEDD